MGFNLYTYVSPNTAHIQDIHCVQHSAQIFTLPTTKKNNIKRIWADASVEAAFLLSQNNHTIAIGARNILIYRGLVRYPPSSLFFFSFLLLCWHPGWVYFNKTTILLSKRSDHNTFKVETLCLHKGLMCIVHALYDNIYDSRFFCWFLFSFIHKHNSLLPH